jgi:hypothetical protein
MPWPMAPREMIFTGTGIFDSQRKACLFVMKSLDAHTNFFEYEVPEAAENHVRIIMKRGYHYLQKIDENRTRYTNISNTDP